MAIHLGNSVMLHGKRLKDGQIQLTGSDDSACRGEGDVYNCRLKLPLGLPALPGRVSCQASTVSGSHPYLMAFPAPMDASGAGNVPRAI